jgi:hypothetical protein
MPVATNPIGWRKKCKASPLLPPVDRPTASTHASVLLAAALWGEKLPWFGIVGLPVVRVYAATFPAPSGISIVRLAAIYSVWAGHLTGISTSLFLPLPWKDNSLFPPLPPHPRRPPLTSPLSPLLLLMVVSRWFWTW